MTRITNLLAFLLAITFSAEVLGYHARPFNTVLTLIFLAVFLWPHFLQGVIIRFRLRWSGTVLGIIALIGVFCSSGWTSVLFISLLIGAVRLLRAEDGERGPGLAVYQATAFCYGIFLWWWRETATGWYVLDGWATALMWMTHHLGLKATLGPTALGMPVLALLFVYGAACIVHMPGYRLPRIAKLLMSLLAVQIVFAATYDATFAGLSVSLVHRGPQGGMVPWYPFAFMQFLYPNNMQVIALLFGSIVTLLVTRSSVQGKEDAKTVVLCRWVAVAGTGAVLVGAALAGLAPPHPPARGEVLIHDSGFLNFDVPVFGFYGHKSGGMFGRLPKFLKADGYRVRQASASRASLKSADVLVVINLMEKFDHPTKKAIWDFVRKGGSLFVLGDHTGLHNIREPLNDLLDPVNIRLNFDSTVPFRDGWLWGYSLPRHVITEGTNYAASEIQIWVGASLSIAPPARPVIIGSHGFSDPGDPANVRDGNLGNLRFDHGEKLGDLPLAAECRYGRGKVLVFGDTSSLQNDALSFSHRFVEDTFGWLANPQRPFADVARRCAAVLLIIAGVVLLAVRSQARSWLTVAAAAFILGWGLGTVPARALSAPSTARNNIAWIDASHLERFSINNMWVDEGIGGLTFNLMRNGYSPLLMRDWDAQALKRGTLLILIGPSRGFQPSEIKEIRRFVEDGGHVILAAGWEDLSGSSELWQEFGLRVEERPLGHLLVKQPEGDIRLHNAWSIDAGREHPEVLCSPWGYAGIVRLRVGKGDFVAIADTQFLLDKNLEGMEGFCPENVGFLSRLLQQRNPSERDGLGSQPRRARPGVDDGTLRLSGRKGYK